MHVRPRAKILAFFAFLIVVDWLLYFRHADHFFQGDTVFLLDHRAPSPAAYLKEFVALNPSGWYRPLANELLESILYPAAGLNPIPYRIPVYALFLATTLGVYALALALTRKHAAAALAAFFFTIHISSAYATYDVGFMPELLYALFFIGSVLAWLRYAEYQSKTAYGTSVLCFVLSLLSKEAAVTLPAVLLSAGLLIDPRGRPLKERARWTLRSLIPHLIVFIAYMAFAFGYLQVQNFSVRKLLDPSEINVGGYEPVFNRDAMKDADLALSWAFNIPRGWWASWQHLKPGMLGFLKTFRVLFFALLVFALFRPERKIILFGIAWFWITVLPALPLGGHFLPYYLFLPMAGFAVIAGALVAEVHSALEPRSAIAAAAMILVLAGGELWASSRVIRTEIDDSYLLGASAKRASGTLNDLKRLYPSLPDHATLYFADAADSVSWDHDNGRLIRMAYARDDISTLYESLNDKLPSPKAGALVFRVEAGRLFQEIDGTKR